MQTDSRHNVIDLATRRGDALLVPVSPLEGHKQGALLRHGATSGAAKPKGRRVLRLPLPPPKATRFGSPAPGLRKPSAGPKSHPPLIAVQKPRNSDRELPDKQQALDGPSSVRAVSDNRPKCVKCLAAPATARTVTAGNGQELCTVPKTEDIDMQLRRRIAGHLRRLYDERGFQNVQEMADVLGMDRSTLSRYLNGERTIGLDVLFRVHRRFYVSTDTLMDQDPPARYLTEPSPPEGVRPAADGSEPVSASDIKRRKRQVSWK